MPFLGPKKKLSEDEILKELRSVRTGIEEGFNEKEVYYQAQQLKINFNTERPEQDDRQIKFLLEVRTTLLKRASKILSKAEKKIEFLQIENQRLRNLLQDLDIEGRIPIRLKIKHALKEIFS